MAVSVTVLVENTASAPRYQGEYGWAIMVETPSTTILLDTGSSADALFHNTRAAHKDLSRVDRLIISHGHFDHTGGLKNFLQKFPAVPLYVHSAAFSDHNRKNADDSLTYIGSPVLLKELTGLGIKVEFTDQFTEIAPDIFVTGSIPRRTDFEDAGGPFFLSADRVDEIIDDQALIIKENDDLIIISGCAHAGVVNTMQYALSQTGARHIKTVIGGMHLINADADRIAETIVAFKQYEVERIIPAHCTGFKAAAELYAALGSKVEKAESGSCFLL